MGVIKGLRERKRNIKNCCSNCKLYCFHRGLFISINDLGHVDQLVGNWPASNIKVSTICAKILLVLLLCYCCCY